MDWDQETVSIDRDGTTDRKPGQDQQTCLSTRGGSFIRYVIM